MFADRSDAGQRLAACLGHLEGTRPVVLALPRGGVPVAYEVAQALAAPLGLVFVRKIGVPWQPELAAGAVADGESPVTVFNPEVLQAIGFSESRLQDEVAAKLREIEQRRHHYLEGRPPLPLDGRVAIVVDDGIATGATTRAALRAVRHGRPARLVLAVPVAPPDALAALRDECDEIVCVDTPAQLGAIGAFYADFHQVPDEEVIRLLDAAAPCDEDREGKK